MSGLADPFEQARWLLDHWTEDRKTLRGRGRLCPGEFDPKIAAVAFIIALGDHSSKDFDTREITQLAHDFYAATVAAEKGLA